MHPEFRRLRQKCIYHCCSYCNISSLLAKYLIGFYIHRYSVKEMLGKYSKNVLLMHGIEDAVVSYEYAKWAESTYKNAKLEIFNNEGHGFSENGNRRMEAMAMYFVHDCLR